MLQLGQRGGRGRDELLQFDTVARQRGAGHRRGQLIDLATRDRRRQRMQSALLRDLELGQQLHGGGGQRVDLRDRWRRGDQKKKRRWKK